jgi:DnaK suppressor protein
MWDEGINPHKGATAMKSEMVAKFKKVLLEQRDQITLSRKWAMDGLAVNTDDLSDEMDLSAAELVQSMSLQLHGRELMTLRQINEGLARMESGTFGSCGECSEDIELGRLQAKPTATLCLGCQEAAEWNSKRRLAIA